MPPLTGYVALTNPQTQLAVATRTPPLSILDLMLFVAGVGLVLPMSQVAIMLRGFSETTQAGQPIRWPDYAQFAISFGLTMIHGIALGGGLHLGLRWLRGERRLLTQPGHWLLLVPMVWFLISGPLTHVYWYAFDHKWGIAAGGSPEVLNLVNHILSAAMATAAVLSLLGVTIALRNLPFPRAWQFVMALGALAWLQTLLFHLMVLFQRPLLRVLFARPWYCLVWVGAGFDVVQLLAVIGASALDLRAKVPRDWLHYLGVVLWGSHCALNLASTVVSLVSLYWR